MSASPPAVSSLTLPATLAVALAGAGAFAALGLPLPFLLGPMFACLIAALAGKRLKGPPLIGGAMRAVLGVAVGAAVTPELVGRLGAMAASVALVPLFVAISGALGVIYFRRVARFDRVTAYYAAMPGGLQDMILLGREAGGDARALSLVHVTRVLAIVSIAPALLGTLWGVSLDGPVGDPASALPISEMALMVLAGALGWAAAARVGLFGASILGPMIATAGFSLAGLIAHRPPAEAMIAAQFFIGIAIGVGYVGITPGELRRVVLAGLGYCAILAALSAAFAQGVHVAGLAPPVEALLAFAPGGQAEMALIAIVAGADAAFIVTHHLVRLVVVIAGAPVAARLMRPDPPHAP